MQVNLTGHHVEITEALRSHVMSKIERVERHFNGVGNAHVILTVEKLVQKAEVTVHVTGNNVFAEASGDDMYAAIDLMVDKLDRQVKKYKEKLTNHHRGAVQPTQE